MDNGTQNDKRDMDWNIALSEGIKKEGKNLRYWFLC